ncbi:MAG: hypothetical protein WA461_15860 [Nitrososphaeraceae archaeon]
MTALFLRVLAGICWRSRKICNEIGKGIRLSIEMLRKQICYFTLPAEILPLVLKKYPDLKNQFSNNATAKGIINGINAINQIVQSARSRQWDRNLLEWIDPQI